MSNDQTSSHIIEGNLSPPHVGGQQVDPSASSNATSSHRTKRKRDEKAPPAGSLPRSDHSDPNNKQQIRDQGAKLPSFDSPPVYGIPSQGATIVWDDVLVIQQKGDGHDSDSSAWGSGSIISTHSRSPKRSRKRQRVEPLSGLKPPDQQQARDGGEHGTFNIGSMQDVKKPETSALGPLPNFTLGNLQPISPGTRISWDDVNIVHVAQPKGDDGHDSDSSGSGGFISTHRRSPKRSRKHQRVEPLSGLKPPDQQQAKDRGEHGTFNIGSMQNVKQPEVPPLGPLPNFTLGNLQPISPGTRISWDDVNVVHVAQPKGDDGHDSDSSGSGGFISTHRRSPKRSRKHQRVEPLSGLKPPDQQQAKDRGEHGTFNVGSMQNAKQPEAPPLGLLPNFTLGKMRPISAGIVDILDHELQEQQQQHLKDVACGVAAIAAAAIQKQLPSKGYKSRLDFEEREHIEGTLEAIERKGALSHTVVHGVFVGPARSGKNSLMENLLGQLPPFKSPSTGVAEAVVQVQVEKLTTVAATIDKGSIWSIIDDNDEVIRLISMHSNPRNIQYNQQDGIPLAHDYNTCARVRPFILNSPKKYDTPLEILTTAIENKGLDALQKFFDTSWSLYLSNTGGQIEFQEILPLLVSGPCVFFYTFRLDRDLNKHYTIEYELQDGTKSELYKSTLTTIEGIQQSLASIAAMGIFVYQGREKKEVQLQPKIFFVGTHRDLLPSNAAESIIAEKDKYLQESTRQFVNIIEFASSSQMIFTVDNFCQDKSAFQKIRSAVERAVERHEFEMVCPSHWLILSFALRRFEQEVVSYEECFEVAKQCGIVDKEEFNDALRFIHTKMGLIRYFPHEYVKDIVVVKPQLLYDKISELIVKTFTFDKAGKQSAEQFIQKGIFSLDEFERICRKCGEGSMKASQFAKLLEKLRITAPLETDGDKVTKYFIPCVLAHAAKAKEQIETLSSEIPPLVIRFKCGYCPKGIGGALISYLMAIKHPDLEWKLLTDSVFRDQVTFEVGPLDTVVLKILSSHLIVACIPSSNPRLRKHCYIEKICIDVRKAVEAGIKRVTLDIDFIDSEVEHSLTFLCPCDTCQGQYPAELKNYDGKPHCLRCTKTRACHELPKGYEKWFNVKSQTQLAKITEYYFTQDNLSEILLILKKHAPQWREIGAGLKFTEYELDNIENMPLLLPNAPKSWFRTMLSRWLQWAPGDDRGSTSFATLEALKGALSKAGLATTANDLGKIFEQKLAVHSQ